MVAIESSAAHEIGLLPMDRTHREFIELYNTLANSGSAEFLGHFNNLISHTVAHFHQENVWMERSGFPPIAIHRGEHDRVLGLMRTARDGVAAGDLESGRNFAAQLPVWFEQHAATMDTALAMHMKRRGFEAEDAAAVVA